MLDVCGAIRIEFGGAMLLCSRSQIEPSSMFLFDFEPDPIVSQGGLRE